MQDVDSTWVLRTWAPHCLLHTHPCYHPHPHHPTPLCCSCGLSLSLMTSLLGFHFALYHVLTFWSWVHFLLLQLFLPVLVLGPAPFCRQQSDAVAPQGGDGLKSKRKRELRMRPPVSFKLFLQPSIFSSEHFLILSFVYGSFPLFWP